MTEREISVLRLFNQQVQSTKFQQPQELVGWMAAMQAQDYAMAKWAVGSRLPKASEQTLEQALDAGTILRTHLMRPTWHFVAAADIRWMQALTGPIVKAAVAGRDKNLGLDESIFRQSNALLEKILSNGKHLTRQELMIRIEKEGIPMDNFRIAHVMMRAELDAIVCNGIRKGKEHTYTLLEEKVPASKSLTKEEALATLVLRYFSSHGPATLADFIWWSGIKTTDARRGLEAVESQLICEKVNGQDYWLSNNFSTPSTNEPTAFFLAAFDEFVISYRDRSASLDTAWGKHAISSNGIFKPLIVLNGQVIGIWKRTHKKDSVQIEQQLFTSISPKEQDILEQAAWKYANYEEKKLIFNP